jgi:4-diphosphocytidyl-2-C-methyl-D-erythritol kinase
MTDAAHRTPVIRLAPAKLNLTLAVVGRRSDGFHDLHSVFVPLALADRLSLAPAGPGAAGSGAAGGEDTLHVAGFDAGPTVDNLVLRGIASARAAVGQGPNRPATPPLAARLEKHVPVAAGLGGGSSDGAAALDGALEAWGASDAVDLDARSKAAASVGSDVPFFLVGRPALVEGRGERVTPLGGIHGHPGVLLVTPWIAIRTPDVFSIFDGARGTGDGSVRMTSAHLAQELGNGLSATDLLARAGVLASANDLLAAATLVAPDLVAVRRALTRVLGRPVGLTGSGPTLWTLYPSLGEAEAAAAVVGAAVADATIPSIGKGPPTVIATTIRTGDEGPAT